ncbi:M16 family metallopeptidase [Pasteurella canis]|uniref:M16 family metallopeptidase n=1 Tax=Pasteurella canis TaxID=753 RepID=UPI001CBCDB03|nr:insulinase family protein [Pasteurella canis]UAX43057.1 insulinase family protein [Pasteurella canis]
MKKLTALLSAFLFLFACHSTTQTHSEQLPFDHSIQHGKLENGLTYYVMQNPDPANRVYIRLVVNAGSMHEDDDQKGIAHLVEHMAFNGSKKFPENQIINALEKLGMKFARDINAFTDFENTVYTLNLDKNDNKSLALAFDVLNEWMHNLTILQKDLDNERGIVQEEWRRRLSPMLRLGDKKSAVEMAGSRYVLRDPIGDMNIIRNISRQRVADFYHKWYRPDNMSVIIVGDIKPKEVTSLLKEQLNIVNPISETPLQKIDFSIPLVNQWRLASISEKGTNIPTIELSFFETFKEKNTLASYKQDLIQQILIRLTNLRLQTWEQVENQNIESANFYRAHLGKETLQNIFLLQLFDTDYQKVTQSLFSFIAEIKQHGFSEQEFQQEISRLVKLNEKQRTIKSGSLKIADDLIISAANNQIVVSNEDRYRLNQRFLQDITLNDINQQFKRLLDIQAKLLLITQPYPATTLLLKQNDVEKMWQKTITTPQHNWVQQKQKAEMPAINIASGEIKKYKYWQKGDITEYQLENGSKLIYHYSDKTPNQVYFKAITNGGLRSVSSKDYHLFKTAVTLTDDSGVGNLTLSDINQLFSQSPIALATIVDDYKQGFTAVGKTEQLDDLLKLFRLKLQGTAVTEQVLERYKKETIDYFRQIDKETEFIQKVSALRYPNIATVYNSTRQELLSFSAKQLTDFYQDTVLGKTDFTYFIIGDISQKQVEALAKTYLASIQVNTQSRQTYDVSPKTPNKPFVMHGLGEPRAEVEIYLSTQNQWQPELQYQLDLLGDILQEKLRLALREQSSGIYAVNSWFGQDKDQDDLEGKIEFSCAPERVQELTAKTHQILDEMMRNGVESSLLQKKVNEKHTQIKQQFDSLVSIAAIIEQSFWHTNSTEGIYLYQKLEQLSHKNKIDDIVRKILHPSARFQATLKP